MTKDSTGKVLEGIVNDADAADQVAEGDFTAFADEDLTDAERALLQAAAAELADADVSGFGGFAKFDGIDGESKDISLGGLNLRAFPTAEFPRVTQVISYTGLE